MSLRIGFVLPNSNFIVGVSQDIVKAFKLGLQEEREDQQYFVEIGGYNADLKIVKEKIQSLIIKDDINVIFAPLNISLIPGIQDLLVSNGVLLIGNWMGEDFFHPEYFGENTFVNGFGAWKSSWLQGYFLGNEIGKSSCSASCIHEGGYGFPLAFNLGFEAADGVIEQAVVSHQNARTESPEPQIRELIQNKTDVISAFYSSKEGISFLNTWSQIDGEKPTLSGSYSMYNDDVLKETGNATLGQYTVGCWDLHSENEANTTFVHAFKGLTGKVPHEYALMAYESGSLLKQAMKALEEDGKGASVENLKKALSEVKFDGPRGEIGFSAEGNSVETPHHHLFQIVEDKDGVKRKWVKELDTPQAFDDMIEQLKENMLKQGWTNPYLIA